MGVWDNGHDMMKMQAEFIAAKTKQNNPAWHCRIGKIDLTSAGIKAVYANFNKRLTDKAVDHAEAQNKQGQSE